MRLPNGDLHEIEEPLHGGFSVWVNGLKVARGCGPYERIKAQAAHYAMQYANEGKVKVRVYKFPVRKAVTK